jgi:hypothetical protein
MTKVYMKITKDKYELPLAVANSAEELARICGVTRNGIDTLISLRKSGKFKTSYIKVEIEDSED